MARMKFLTDAERCIECNGCVVACKNENEVPWGINRRRVGRLGRAGGEHNFLRFAAGQSGDLFACAFDRRPGRPALAMHG